MTWLRDGAPVAQSEKIETKVEEDSHTLIIKEATVEDVGEYTCQAENVTTKTELEVKSEDEKVEIEETSYTKEQIGTKGQDITFSVNFKQTLGSKPSATWFFNSKEVSSSERVSG